MAVSTMITSITQIQSGWQNDVIRAARANMVMPKLVFQDWKWDKSMGDTVNVFRGAPNYETHAKLHGTDGTPDAYTDAETQKVLINHFTYAMAQFDDVARLFIREEYVSEVKNSFGYGLNRDVETTLTAMFANFSQQASGSALGTEASWDVLVNANQLLQEANVDPDSDRVHLIVSPAQEAAMKKMSHFTNSLTAGGEGPNNLTKSRIAQTTILGCGVYRSNLLNSPATGQHALAMWDQRALALIFAQRPKMFEEFLGPSIGTVYGCWQAFGVAEVNRYAETLGSVTPVDTWAVYIPAV